MDITDTELQVLIEKISLDHNWDLNSYKIPTLKRRIASRIHDTKCSSVEAYYRLIEESPDEYKKLLDVITVNYTYWFRDEDVWEGILRMLYEKSQKVEGKVAVWSAGCSTGEEPYSLAILASKIDKDKFKIHASDIDDRALNAAKNGLFEKFKINLQEEEIEKYFDKQGPTTFKIKDSFKSLVEFTKIDLSKDQYPKNLDMITCRNVMIYFNKILQEKVYQDFCYALKKGGIMVTGNVENLPPKVRHLFEIVDNNLHIYRKL